MIVELKASRYGAGIADIPGTCLCFDDGALVTLSQYVLQKQAHLTVTFSWKWRFQRSTKMTLINTKSAVKVYKQQALPMMLYGTEVI